MLLDVVSSALADAGIAHVRYLDDFLLVGTTPARAWASAHMAARILMDFGLALSPGKVEGPAYRLEFLGIIIDTQAEVVAISEARQEELTELLTCFQRSLFLGATHAVAVGEAFVRLDGTAWGAPFHAPHHRPLQGDGQGVVGRRFPLRGTLLVAPPGQLERQVQVEGAGERTLGLRVGRLHFGLRVWPGANTELLKMRRNC